MKVSLAVKPGYYTTTSKVRFSISNQRRFKNLNQITLELDQEGVNKPSKAIFDFFTSTQQTGVNCGLENNNFYFDVDFEVASETFKYVAGKPIKALAKIKLNSGEIVTENLPDVILS